MKSDKKQPLPKPNVEFAVSGDLGKMTDAKVRSLFCNPIYVGINGFPALIDDETWIHAASRMIRDEGAEQFLVNMLHVLRQSFPSEAANTEDEMG